MWGSRYLEIFIDNTLYCTIYTESAQLLFGKRVSGCINELGLMRKEFHKNIIIGSLLKNLKPWFNTEIHFLSINLGLLQ